MTCNKSALAAVACFVVAAFDTLTAVSFSKRKVFFGVCSAIASALVQIGIMPYVDAHLIAAIAAIAIPASVYIAAPRKLTARAKWGIGLVLLAIPIGFGARSSSADRTCPKQEWVAACFIVSTLVSIMLAGAATAENGAVKLLPVIDGILGAAATLSAELVSLGTYEGALPLITHGCAALAAAAVSLRKNPVEYHVPTSYAVWMAGLLVTDMAVGHNINLRYALAQAILSAIGVRLLI